MAIKLPDPGNGIPEQKTGNDEWTNMKIVRDNFADQSNAASRLVGESTGNVLEVGAFGIGAGSSARPVFTATNLNTAKDGFIRLQGEHGGVIPSSGYAYNGLNIKDGAGGTVLVLPTAAGSSSTAKTHGYRFITYNHTGVALLSAEIYTTANVTKDGNGFLKGASPVVDLYDDHIDLNIDAEMQGVEFIKNGTGDYTLKTKTGLRSDNTWQIEIPQDNNKNPLFAVDIDAQEDGTVNIKCYKRIFSMETFLFGPDFNEPMDIAEGRFISVRLNDNPEEQLDEPAI